MSAAAATKIRAVLPKGSGHGSRSSGLQHEIWKEKDERSRRD
jgi:hypothetical protein